MNRAKPLTALFLVICFLTVIAVSVARADVTIFAVGPATWQEGVAGGAYSLELQVAGGVAPYTWSVVNGQLPDGLILDSSTGLISGTSTTVGTYAFTVQVQDFTGGIAVKDFAISVYPSVGGFSYSRVPSGTTISNPLTVHIKGVFGADFCDNASNSYAVNVVNSSGQLASSGYVGNVAPGTVVDRDFIFSNL